MEEGEGLVSRPARPGRARPWWYNTRTRMLTRLIDGLGHTQRGPRKCQFLALERCRFSKMATIIFERLLY